MKSEFIDRESLIMLLDLMGEDNERAVLVSLYTGLRIGDVLALRLDHFTEQRFRTVCEKTGKPFEGELPANLAAALCRDRGSPWCFPSPKNAARHRTRQAVWRDLKNAAEKAGIDVNVTPHTARKIFAVERFRRKGLTATQEALGHDRADTTLIYAFSNLLGAKSAKKGEKVFLEGEKSVPQDTFDRFFAAFVEALGGREALGRALHAALNCLFPSCVEGGAETKKHSTS